MQIFVIAGHGAGDPGACGYGYSEAERVRALAQRIKDLGGDDVILGDFERNYYADNGISYLDLPAGFQLVELHMDSCPESAHGGHVIIQAGVGGADEYDEALAGVMAEIFPGRSNLIVERDDLANPWRATVRGFSYRLVENGFISNEGDIDTFNSRLDDIALGYLKAFGIKEVEPPMPEQNPGNPINNNGLKYQAHVQNIGWCDWVHDGQIAGTVGYAARLEALRIDCPDGYKLDVKAHIQDKGWVYYENVTKDTIIGTVGEGKRLEALEFILREYKAGKKFRSRAHVQNVGWMDWTDAPYPIGTMNQGLRMEAIQLVLV